MTAASGGSANYKIFNYTLALSSIGEKLMIDPPPPNRDEVAVLIVTATVGMVGNFGILIVILLFSRLRTASNAFLFHQSALDLVKSAFCLPFAQTMVNDRPPAFCSIMGGSYIVFVTTSAFNILGIVMNESYQFADLMMGIKDSRNCCCIIFGIFMIWFTSIIMNLGVAFIPGNPSFDREMGHCIFVYGITRNYVLHMLWIVLITMALAMTLVYLRMLYLDIKRSSYYRMTTLVRATVSIDTSVESASQRRQSYQRQKLHIKRVLGVTRKKLYLLIALTMFFILFWYPLFVLTAVDPGFKFSPKIYKTVTIIAWCNPSVTPIIVFFFLRTICCCRNSDNVPDSISQTPNQTPENQSSNMPSEKGSKENDQKEQDHHRFYAQEDRDFPRHHHRLESRSPTHNQSLIKSEQSSMLLSSTPGGAVGGYHSEEDAALLSIYTPDGTLRASRYQGHNDGFPHPLEGADYSCISSTDDLNPSIDVDISNQRCDEANCSIPVNDFGSNMNTAEDVEIYKNGNKTASFWI